MKWRGGYCWMYDELWDYSDWVDRSMAVIGWIGLTLFWAVVVMAAVFVGYEAFVNGFWLFYHTREVHV